MQRKPKCPPNRKVLNNDKAFALVAVSLFCIFLSVVIMGVFQCSKTGDVFYQHERDVITICQKVDLSLYTSCLKREWDRIHNKESKR